MSFGAPSIPPVPSPAPIRIMPEMGAMRSDLIERLKRARSRQTSRVMPMGLMEFQPERERPALAQVLG